MDEIELSRSKNLVAIDLRSGRTMIGLEGQVKQGSTIVPTRNTLFDYIVVSTDTLLQDETKTSYETQAGNKYNSLDVRGNTSDGHVEIEQATVEARHLIRRNWKPASS
jgi:hypothetical protein